MDIPTINRKAVCITTDETPELAREISSYFSDTIDYFATFRFMKLREAKKEEFDFAEDEYIGQVLGNNNSIYISNTIARIEPEFIIFAGLDKNQESFFSKLPPKQIIRINSSNDIKEYPDIFKESARIAGVENKFDSSENLIVVEDGHDLSTIIAENLARAIKAKIVYVDKTEDRILAETVRYIDEWKEHGKDTSRVELDNLIKSRVGHIDFSQYKSATFFTNGLPYGLILNNPIPFCYIRKRLREDIFIINSIIYSEISFGTGICFSIDDFLNSEPKDVSSIFIRNELIPIQLFKDKASAFNFEHYVGYLPYDILHISSHGDIKTEGNRVTESFKDRKGADHIIEYYEVPTFTGLPLDNSDEVAVYIKNIFLKLDGVRWMSKELSDKKLPQYIFEDMRKAIFSRDISKRIAEVVATDPIIDSSTLMCNDGPHQGQFHEIASQNAPFIFNNSCWSWSEISIFFLAGGVRGYLGTLWPIDDSIATKAATVFYEDILDNGKTLIDAVWEINKKVSTLKTGQENIFFIWTLPFTKMKKSEDSDLDNFIGEVTYKLYKWMEKAKTTKQEDIRKNTERIITFIIWVIYKEFGVNLIEITQEKAVTKFGYDINKHSSVLKRSSPR